MPWGHLGTQFCLELAFGVALFLCLVPRAPLGPFFFRMMATTALVPLLIAACVPPLFAEGRWGDPVVVLSLLASLGLLVQMGPLKARQRLLPAVLTCGCVGAALFGVMGQAATGLDSTPAQLLGAASAMATGAVAGGVGFAMVVGHWYLTVPSLPVELLVRLNRFTMGCMLASVILMAVVVGFHYETLESADMPLLSPYGLVFFFARIAVGLLLPLLFAWMTAGSLRYQNTRSATGILYASTVLVLIGTAASLSLQDQYGIPL